MLLFHKCCRIYEIKGSVICEIRVKGFINFARRALGSHLFLTSPASRPEYHIDKGNDLL